MQEPLSDIAWVDDILARTARHELVARRLDLATGTVTIEPAVRGEAFVFDGRQLRALFGPRWRLLIIGAGQLSRAVAQMALMLDFEVTCCDPRGNTTSPGTFRIRASARPCPTTSSPNCSSTRTARWSR